MSWLAKLLESALVKVLSKLSVKLFDYFKAYFEQSARRKELNKMADDVQKIAEEIKKLKKEGLEIPQELKDKLREASKKLVDSSNVAPK